MTRAQIVQEITKAGCTCVGFEFQTDQRVEVVYQKWKKMDSPKYAVLVLENDSDGKEVTLVIQELE